MVGEAIKGEAIAGTTAGEGTVGKQAKPVGGGTATPTGGIIDHTTVARGIVGTMTGAGTIDGTIDGGRATLAGGETNRCYRTERGVMPELIFISDYGIECNQS